MKHSKPDLLIVDDDPLITDALAYVLEGDFSIHIAESRSQAERLLRQLGRPPQLALVDLGLPPVPHRPDEGFRLIVELLARAPDIKIIVLSGQNDEDNARHARTIGAIEFIGKPYEAEQLRSILLEALAAQDAERKAAGQGIGIVGDSLPVQKLRQQIVQYADAPFPVLIEGESGSGKELVAASLHRQSSRSGKPYFALNCAAISPTLVEPTLFGYAKGAFTGATSTRAGYFEDAVDSTLFLDEIGELPLELQAKLLRVLENGEFQRVGETQSRHSNARVVTATNRDLRQEVKAGRFRADLYHRLSVFAINAPPLRSLGDDKCMLLDHFRLFYAQQGKAKVFKLDDRAQDMWMKYPFPGNVRELRNIVIRLATKYAGQIVTLDKLQPELDVDNPSSDEAGATFTEDIKSIVERAKEQLRLKRHFDLDSMLRQWEQGYVEAALDITNGNLSQAAKLLGIQRTTLYCRMRQYGADNKDAAR